MTKKILFVCNLNAVRSVLAEYMVNEWYSDKATAQSSGIIAGSPDGYAASVAMEEGLDIIAHESRYLEDVDCTQFDEIISFSLEAANEVARLKLPSSIKCHYWEVRDLASISGNREERLILYRGVFEDVKKHLLQHFMGKKG